MLDASPLPEDAIATAREKLDDLRSRLLDLTLRNPFLNFRHRDGAKAQLRIIDELPDQLLSQLMADSKPFKLAPLPEPEDEPKDERSTAFQKALSAEKATDETYLAAIQEFEEDDPDSAALREAERALKDKVRETLGMAPWVHGRMLTRAEWARKNNISPSHELPYPGDMDQADKHQDSDIQTLLFADDLERRGRNLIAEARRWREEKGVDALYLALGFLEWRETPNSERALLAPLLLIPVVIDRKTTGKGATFEITLGQGGVKENTGLRKKLEADFGLTLPVFQADEDGENSEAPISTPEAYFEAVSAMAAKRPKWRVRRFGTFAPFTFANIAIYDDLDPKNWPGDSALEQRPLIAGLLGGRQLGEANDSHATTSLLEDRTPAPAPLVMDADASQYAIVHAAAIHEQDLAVQGPPGSGKSQTIVNLIAAALHQGKRVLFVAEKAAALDVVAKRLESVGLGEFCMDLHGPGARREEVLADLKARIDAPTSRSVAADLQQALDAVKQLKSSLSNYAATINTQHGSLGLTIHDIIWKEQATRTIDLPAAIDDITLEDAAGVTKYRVDEAHDLLGRIAAADKSFRADHGAPDAHPWRALGDRPAPQNKRLALTQLVSAWRQALEDIARTEGGWRDVGIDLPASLAALRRTVQAASKLPEADPAADPALFKTLSTPEAVAKLEGYLDAASERLNALSVLDAAFTDVEAATAQQGLAGLAAALEEVIGARPASDLHTIETQRLEEAAALDATMNHARQFIQAIGVEEPGKNATVGALRRALAAASILRETPASALLWRRAIASDRDAADAIIEGKRQRDAILASITRLREETGISLDRLGDAQSIAADQSACLNAGFLAGWFDSAFKAARTRARAAGCAATDKARLSDALGKSLVCRQEESAFNAASSMAQALHGAFQGMDTDFDSLAAASTFGDAVREAFGGLEPDIAHARQTLLHVENDQFADMRDIARSPAFDALQAAAQALVDDAPETNLAAIPEAKRDNAAHASGFIARTAEIGLRPNATAAMLAYAAQAQRALTRAETTMGPETAFGGLSPDQPMLHATVALARRIQDALGDAPTLLSPAFSGDYEHVRNSILQAAKTAAIALDTEEKQRGALDAEGFETAALFAQDLQSLHPQALARAAEAAERSGEVGLDGWVAYRRSLIEAENSGFGDLIRAFQTEQRPMDGLVSAYDRALYRSLVHDAVAAYPVLAEHSGAKAGDMRSRFRKIDRETQDLTAKAIAAKLSGQKGPAGNAVGKVGTKTERGLIEHYAPQKKPRVPLRRLFARAPEAIQALKPCLMLSPATVAEVLSPGAMTFDLLVIDEASQMKPEFAMGALARSARAVIVGDEMQLPPTDFFNRARDDGDDSEDEDEADAVRHESILALANATLKPERQLLWHYRSRHESLIAYSNQQFYNNKLVVFPAARKSGGNGLGVSFERVVDGKYTPGSRINPNEANAIVAAAIARMKQQPDRSIGIVAMNTTQRDYIQDRFNQETDGDAAIQAYLDEWRAEGLDPFFIKNLETVQGDERDVILISATYGPDAKNGTVMQRFGPINGAHGHRRLNVLFTRARMETVVFASLTANDIRVSAGAAPGLVAFKGFLAFAATGLLQPSVAENAVVESPFEAHVARLLEQRGFQVEPQVGVAGYRIDLGVKHPSFEHGYIAGVECDGASYHSAASARDRDRLRQEALENLGWTIIRVWSTDWFDNPNGEVNRLVEKLENAARRAAP